MTDVLPSVSTMGRRRTSALRFTIRRTPIASEIVTTAGRASGTTATASAMPNMNISITGRPRARPIATTSATTASAALPSVAPRRSRFVLERRPAGLDGLHQPGDRDRTRSTCRCDDYGLAAAVGDQRPGVQLMFLRSPSGSLAIVEAGDCLLDRRRFAGERGFVDGEVDGLRHTRVGGNAIAGAQQHDVSRHQLPRRHDRFVRVAKHARDGRSHLSQGLERSPRAVLLDETRAARRTAR